MGASRVRWCCVGVLNDHFFFFSFCVGLEVGVIPSGLGVMGWLRRCSLSHVMA